MTIKEFKDIIPKICKADTCNLPEVWDSKNPTMGHCAIVSLLAQELFGGTIIRVSLESTLYEKLKSHYFNIIDGVEYDFTLDQFESNPYLNKERHVKNREDILSNLNTKRRYDFLKNRFEEAYLDK